MAQQGLANGPSDNQPLVTSPAGTIADIQERLEKLKTTARATHPKQNRIPMRQLFDLAKDFSTADPVVSEHLLLQRDHAHRVVAVSIMDFQARDKKTSAERRRELYELYLRRHDHIDTWDLIDRAAPHVIGGYLSDKSRQPLYELAISPQWWERRTAIVSTWFFIRQDDVDDTFRIGDILANDPEDLVQKAVGGWIREAGKRDQPRLLAYLDQHAATMPRTALRYAIEHLDPDTRSHYLGLGREMGR
jgi:3-methyladenine DNA glycosylase AlkD